MTTLYLVRHGETEENAAHILQGHMPGKLSDRGIEQLRILRRELSLISFDAVLSSDLQRCVDSTCILTEGRTLSISYLSLLRERDWGSLTGKFIADIQGNPFPDDVESVGNMLHRAADFLKLVEREYPNQTILTISHGLFCRAIRAVHTQTPMKQIDRMQNATYHILTL